MSVATLPFPLQSTTHCPFCLSSVGCRSSLPHALGMVVDGPAADGTSLRHRDNMSSDTIFTLLFWSILTQLLHFPYWLPFSFLCLSPYVSSWSWHLTRNTIWCWDQQLGIRNTMISNSTNCLLYRVSGFSIPSWLTCWVHERPAVLSNTFQRAEDLEATGVLTSSLQDWTCVDCIDHW